MISQPGLPAAFSYQAFLSHKYKAPEVNLHFFDLFSSVGEVQFEVDVGTSRISMTRLHRMVRAADAFIGIYPLPGSASARPNVPALREASRYFRLELDLAIRSRKPAIIFYDNRYRSVLRVPTGMYQYGYDAQEILGKGGNPTVGRQRQAIEGFSRVVAAAMEYGAIASATEVRRYDAVGLLLPTSDDPVTYEPALVNKLTRLVQDRGYDCVAIPPAVDANFFETTRQVDWVMADIGSPRLSPLIAFLHGQFTPLLLLRRAPAESDLERSLFGAFEVGYREDTLPWSDSDALLEGVRERLAVIEGEAERLNTGEEAREYFKRAGRRKERVFLSYAGEDLEELDGLRTELHRRFQDVFDYKVDGAIPAGTSWMGDLFASLSKSAVGIICLSRHYLASGSCRHESESLIAQRDEGRTRVFVIKLDDTKAPEYMSNVQYLTRAGNSGDDAIVETILREIGPDQDGAGE